MITCAITAIDFRGVPVSGILYKAGKPLGLVSIIKDPHDPRGTVYESRIPGRRPLNDWTITGLVARLNREAF